MKIAVIVLGLLVAGCTGETITVERKFIEAYNELVTAQEELINVLETQVELLAIKCIAGHEI